MWDKVTAADVTFKQCRDNLDAENELWSQCCRSINSSVYVLCCRQTRDQDERSHLLPSHRGGVLWPFKECTQSKSVYVHVCACLWFLACGIIYTCPIFVEYCWHLFILCFSPSIHLFPSHACVTSPLSLLFSLISLSSQNHIHFRTREPQPFADLQCEDPRSGVLHGGSVAWGYAYLDGCYGYRCWRTHAFHGVTDPNRSGSTPLNFIGKRVTWEGFTALCSYQRNSKHPLCRGQVNKKWTSVYISSLQGRLMLKSTLYNVIMYNRSNELIYKFHN